MRGSTFNIQDAPNEIFKRGMQGKSRKEEEYRRKRGEPYNKRNTNLGLEYLSFWSAPLLPLKVNIIATNQECLKLYSCRIMVIYIS